ncbi:MAG: hypothetical protein V7L21_18535 [Nostoc sp.]|uniref:hypothetical protein n=1 Tax=Nostoc sp. TaxID=1180 RepID=UPI002FFCA00B
MSLQLSSFLDFEFTNEVLYQVRLITYLPHLYKNPKSLFPPAPCNNCGLNDKSLAGHDISFPT